MRHQSNVFSQNPYWAAYQFRRFEEKDRILGNVSLKFDFTDWLYIQGRLGIDFATNNLETIEAYGTAFKPLGSVNINTRNIRERNSDLFIGFDKKFGDFGVDVLLGGNIQRFTDERNGGGGNELNIPFFHSVTNVKERRHSYQFRERGINSIFGQANISYKDMLFLNFTGREDKFSTLSEGNNSVFYPSVGLSFILTDALNIPKEIISYAKLRTAWAQVGGGAPDPYALLLTYSLDDPGHNDATSGRITNNSIPNSKLQPYLSTEIEYGVDLRFFNGRLGFDFTYYSRETEDDILNANISRASGYASTRVNIGELTNKGIELLISGTPVRIENFTWNASFNMAHNTSKAINLGSDAEGNQIEFLNREEARTRQERIRHVVGEPLGVIAGYKHKRIDGQKVYDADGYPVRGEFETLGEGRHPFSAGLNNSFNYKNFNLSFLLDVKMGGSIMSGTNVLAYSTGLHKETLVGREDGLTVNGVDEDGNGFTKQIPANLVDDYYGRYNDITEYFVYDASFAKLREVSISYSIPKSLLDRTPLESLSLSLVGRNLLLLWSNVPNIDPESGYSSTAGSQGLEFFALPTTRNFGFNLSAQF